jgi:hypothetical protein
MIGRVNAARMEFEPDHCRAEIVRKQSSPPPVSPKAMSEVNYPDDIARRGTLQIALCRRVPLRGDRYAKS